MTVVVGTKYASILYKSQKRYLTLSTIFFLSVLVNVFLSCSNGRAFHPSGHVTFKKMKKENTSPSEPYFFQEHECGVILLLMYFF